MPTKRWRNIFVSSLNFFCQVSSSWTAFLIWRLTSLLNLTWLRISSCTLCHTINHSLPSQLWLRNMLRLAELSGTQLCVFYLLYRSVLLCRWQMVDIEADKGQGECWFICPLCCVPHEAPSIALWTRREDERLVILWPLRDHESLFSFGSTPQRYQHSSCGQVLVNS